MNRRRFLIAGATLLAAPAIIKVSALMPVKMLPQSDMLIAWLRNEMTGTTISVPVTKLDGVYRISIPAIAPKGTATVWVEGNGVQWFEPHKVMVP